MSDPMLPPGIEAAVAEGHSAWVEGLRGQCGIPKDWTYRRTPYATQEALSQLFDLLGKDNYQVVSGYGRDGGSSLSVFVSPEGMDRLTAYSTKAHAEVKP